MMVDDVESWRQTVSEEMKEQRREDGGWRMPMTSRELDQALPMPMLV